eukprot:CAMPEP_0113691644 /NCGR_PEP_ID=MMETSP0038_2-20120614/18582_1 /TAXON_ID=2898 /ORGANISM="Cryptomonas paramecium" /LENGTH=96 /DNA_ID=CAMNT_0000613345 /DNA_START=351 /DNA_END=638 /DNA_ORIENTATION=- /assembly_acc=CAM_ASM_000170
MGRCNAQDALIRGILLQMAALATNRSAKRLRLPALCFEENTFAMCLPSSKIVFAMALSSSRIKESARQSTTFARQGRVRRSTATAACIVTASNHLW